MGLLLTTIARLVVWIVLWSIGVKSFDAFLIASLMILLAATARVVAPCLPATAGRSTPAAAGRHANALLTGDLLRHFRRDE